MTPFNYNPFLWDQSPFTTLTGGIRADHFARGIAFMPDAPMLSVAVDCERIYVYGDFNLTVRATMDHAPTMLVRDGLWEPGTPVFQNPANPWTTQPADGIYIQTTPNGPCADISLVCVTGGVVSQSAPVLQFVEYQFTDWTLTRAGAVATLSGVGSGAPSASLPCTTVPIRRSHACQRLGSTLGFYVVYAEDLEVS